MIFGDPKNPSDFFGPKNKGSTNHALWGKVLLVFLIFFDIPQLNILSSD
jgi:hypothetical protein